MTLVLDTTAYNVISFLGKGSFGSVVLAENESGHPVAIKRIYDESWINNNEISALLRLNHPGIIKLHGYHCSDDAHYIIMDYVAGGDLLGYLKTGACTEKMAQIMFRQLVLAIKAAHKRNIYHGDLRLENILIDADRDQIILADWGFASFSKLRRVKQIPYGGDCIEYKPPEFFTAKVVSNAMLDVWMLGIVVYAMMTQKFPFHRHEEIGKLNAGASSGCLGKAINDRPTGGDFISLGKSICNRSTGSISDTLGSIPDTLGKAISDRPTGGDFISLGNDVRSHPGGSEILLDLACTSSGRTSGSCLDNGLMEDIIQCRYTVPEFFSPSLQNLIGRIFQPEGTRISINGILYHPWLECESASIASLDLKL